MPDEDRPLLRTLNPEVPPERPWSRRRKVLVFGGAAVAAVVVIVLVASWLWTPKHYVDPQGRFGFDVQSRFERMTDEELLNASDDTLAHVVFRDTGRRGDQGESGYFNGFSVTVGKLTPAQRRMSTAELLDEVERWTNEKASNTMRTEGPERTVLNGMPCVRYAEELNFDGEHWWTEVFYIPGEHTAVQYVLQVRDEDRAVERPILLEASSSLEFPDARPLPTD
jgi:hypothetical protein